MHTGPLGIIQWLLGAIMWELIFDGPFPGTTEDRVAKLWAEIQVYYELLGSRNRIGNFYLSMFYHGPRVFTRFQGKAGEVPSTCPGDPN